MIHIGRRLLNKKLFNDVNNVNNVNDLNKKVTELNKVVFTLANRVLTLEKEVINLKSINKTTKNTFDKDMPLL